MEAVGEQKLAGPMRVMGVLLIVFSIIEYGVGGAAYEFLKAVHVGGWWAGIVTFISAIFALISNNRCIVVTGCVFAVIAIILAVIAAIVDGAQASTINSLTGCYEPTTGGTWGSDSGISSAQLCYLSSDDTFNYYGGRTSQCVCSDASGDCFGYSLMSGSDCGLLFTTYYNELSASSTFCAALAVLSLIYAIFTCVNCCSPDQAVPTTIPVAPVNVGVQGGVMYAPAPAPIQYVNPQTGQPGVVPVPGPGGQIVYATPPQGYPQQQVVYATHPQNPNYLAQPQYVYQDPTPMVIEAQPVYEPQQAKW